MAKAIFSVFICFTTFMTFYISEAAGIGSKVDSYEGLRLGSISMRAKKSIPSGAKKYNGHYYYIYTNICNTWEEAERYCESLGGHLAVINDDKENTIVYNMMRSLGYKSAYFGLSDAGHQDDWRWVTGEPLIYTNWERGEPNHERGKEHYGMYYWKFKYTWNDGDFGKGTNRGGDAFICEWDDN